MEKVTMTIERFIEMRDEIARLKNKIEKMERVIDRNSEFEQKIEDVLYAAYKSQRDFYYGKGVTILADNNDFSFSIHCRDILRLIFLDERYDEEQFEKKMMEEDGNE